LIALWHETGRRREAADWEPSTATFSRDGRHVLTAGFDKSARVWTMETGLLTLDLRGHQKTVAAAEFPIDSNPQENMYGLSTGGIMWLPDQNGISQSLREIIQQESLRILNRALPDDNK
jgi:WD40 repeat protein